MSDATDTSTRLSSSEARRIIKDLTGKWPSGPRGLLARSHYQIRREWVSEYGRDIDVPRLPGELIGRLGLTERNIKHFGYDPLTLYKLAADKTHNPFEDDMRPLVAAHSPESSSMQVNRRARLLWVRIKSAVHQIKEEGTAGIWVASSTDYDGYNQGIPTAVLWHRGITIWATSKADAEARARLIAPATGLEPNRTLTVGFRRLGSPDEALRAAVESVNQQSGSRATNVQKLERDLRQAQEKLSAAQAAAQRMIGSIMLLSTPTDTEEVETTAPNGGEEVQP